MAANSYYFVTRHERGADPDMPVQVGAVAAGSLTEAMTKAANKFRLRRRDLIDLDKAEASRREEARKLIYGRIEDDDDFKKLMVKVAAGTR